MWKYVIRAYWMVRSSSRGSDVVLLLKGKSIRRTHKAFSADFFHRFRKILISLTMNTMRLGVWSFSICDFRSKMVKCGHFGRVTTKNFQFLLIPAPSVTRAASVKTSAWSCTGGNVCIRLEAGEKASGGWMAMRWRIYMWPGKISSLNRELKISEDASFAEGLVCW